MRCPIRSGMTGGVRHQRAGEAPEWPSAIYSGLRVFYLTLEQILIIRHLRDLTPEKVGS